MEPFIKGYGSGPLSKDLTTSRWHSNPYFTERNEYPQKAAELLNTGVTTPGHGQKPACTQSALVCEGPSTSVGQPTLRACRGFLWKPMLFKVNHPVRSWALIPVVEGHQ